MTRAVSNVARALVVVSASIVGPLAAAQPASSSLQGRVVRWGTTDPVAKATVELQRVGAGSSAPYVAVTTRDGAFVFAAIPAGQYRIVVTRSGFVRAEYGQRWPNGTGTPITIPAGRAVSNVPVAMLQTGAIAGSVHDQFGRPLGNAEVDAYTLTFRTGRRALSRVQTAVSDDRGEYRLFWLTPGRYFVSARHPDLSSSPMRMGGIRIGGGTGSNGTIGFQSFSTTGDNAAAAPFPMGRQTPAMKEKYMVVYYPNTTDETAAAAVDVGPGGEVPAIDFMVAPVPLHHVRGRVVYESTNEAAMSARVQPMTTAGVTVDVKLDDFFTPERSAVSVECCEGTFDLGLPAGSYTLVASVNNLNTRTTVTVGDGDVEGIVLSLARGFNVKGRLTLEGRAATPAELNAFRVSLAMDPPVSGLVPDSYSTILPNGSFTVAAGRGDFRVAVTPLLNTPGAFRFPAMNPPTSINDLYIKSIRLGEFDVLNAGLHLTGPVQDTLDIVIGSSMGALEGRVVNRDRQPLPNVTVALVPDHARRGRVDLMKSTSSDATGRFRVAGVPPGDYLAFAFDGPDDGEWQNPDMLAARETQGTAVRVAAGAAATVELTALPPAQ